MKGETVVMVLVAFAYSVYVAFFAEASVVGLGGIFFAWGFAFFKLDRDVWYERYNSLMDSAMENDISVEYEDYTSPKVKDG